MAGGSVANTVRGLSVGFGVTTGIIGAYGDDEQGQLFVSNMVSVVSVSQDNNVDGRALLQWLVLRYAVPNLEVIKAAIGFAKQEGLSVSLDLASFEPHLVLGLISQLIKVHTCFSILKFLFYVLDDLLTNSSSN
ncbi:hypothetical protein Bca52824_092685 [Brassica carinata]|uniref:Carbohydrate kinase PfkB domain-containing protein n=1 Tax=Brassica carinata TaxID=52824 RepID=A0A8X7TMG8_BRACI|nr:hypothetical protein Bca52824_092685 [Brassica carinata]